MVAKSASRVTVQKPWNDSIPLESPTNVMVSPWFQRAKWIS